jgi:RsiW-degrading membrane proteinase PrsW (M82 family)
MAKSNVVIGFLLITITLLFFTAACLQGTLALLPDNHPRRARVNEAYLATASLTGICWALLLVCALIGLVEEACKPRKEGMPVRLTDFKESPTFGSHSWNV